MNGVFRLELFCIEYHGKQISQDGPHDPDHDQQAGNDSASFDKGRKERRAKAVEFLLPGFIAPVAAAVPHPYLEPDDGRYESKSDQQVIFRTIRAVHLMI